MGIYVAANISAWSQARKCLPREGTPLPVAGLFVIHCDATHARIIQLGQKETKAYAVVKDMPHFLHCLQSLTILRFA